MYKPQIETASRDVIQDLQLGLVKNQIRYVYEHSLMYKRKYDEAGIRPEDVKTLEDITKLPFTTKKDLLDSQEENPPYGDFLCVPAEEVVRCFQTSGTTGKPVKIIHSSRDWFGMACEHVTYQAYGMGIEKADIVFFPFGYSFFQAWWGWQAGLERMGVTIVPGGGQSSKDRVRNIIEWKATVICGTPTYIIHLGDVARDMGIDLSTQSLVRIIVLAGEPGCQIPSTRKLIEGMWGANCYDGIGATEMPASFGFDCLFQNGVHLIESMFLPEVVNPETGEPVAPGEQGELVMTNLCMETMPLIRYRLGDYVKLNYDRCDCGRNFARMDGGILGRTDNMLFFSGVNIFPSAIENLIRETRQLSSEFQIVVPKIGKGGKLKIKLEPASKSVAEDELKRATEELLDKIKWRIGVTPELEIVEINTLPRFEHKAKRVIKEEE